MKKTMVILTSCSIVLSMYLSFSIICQKKDLCEISMSDVESVTQSEVNRCGNVTYIPGEALRIARCWNGATHKKCKKDNEVVCCDPSVQTDCAPIF